MVPLKCWGNDPFAWGSHRGAATEYRKPLRNLFWVRKQKPFDKHSTFSPQTPIQNFIFNQRLFCRTLKESSSLQKRTTHPLMLYLFVRTVKEYIILPVWRITRQFHFTPPGLRWTLQLLWLIIHVDGSFKSGLLFAPCPWFIPLLLSFMALILALHLGTISNVISIQTTIVSYGFLFLCELFIAGHVGFKAIGYAVGKQHQDLTTSLSFQREKWS